METQEEERRVLSRELHDEVGQSLSASLVGLSNLSAAIRTNAGKQMENEITALRRIVEGTMRMVRNITLLLRPSMLDDLGLEPALRWYTQRQAALTGMDAEFRADPLEERLDPMIETECFRVAQEALTNVVRHSRARAVKVNLSHQDGHLRLVVSDNGVGFDVDSLRREAVEGASLGLLSMEERAARAGGGLEFCSSPGQGTEIRAWFPLKWREPEAQGDFNEH